MKISNNKIAIAYTSGEEEDPTPVKNLPINLVGKNYVGSQEQTSTDNAGRNGFALLEMTTEPLMLGSNIDNPTPDKKKTKVDKKDFKEIIDLLFLLGNEMDEVDQVELANFSNFLLKKYAEVSDIDYSKSFNELLLKVKNSEVENFNEILINLAKYYSKLILSQDMSEESSEESKKIAYEKTLEKANIYLTNKSLNKQAQIYNNPIYVAEQIREVIKIMISRMKPDSQARAYPNIKQKLRSLNTVELSNKKSPGGAAIGVSISLIKNVLNGRDPMFIRLVLDELGKKL